MSLGERKEIRKKMIDLGIRSKQIAEYLNVSPSLVSSFLNDKANMSLENLKKLKEYVAKVESGVE